MCAPLSNRNYSACSRSFQLIYQGKQEYFGIGWNWIDISMITLMLCSYFMWTIMYFRNPSHKDESFKFFVSFADGFYALAIVLSFFRMVYLCQITRFLGLLQLCLGRMLQVSFVHRNLYTTEVHLGSRVCFLTTKIKPLIFTENDN